MRQWHRLYYALAAFNLCTILGSLILTHTLLRGHGIEVDVNSKWVTQFEALDKVRNSGALVNAPANDIFETRNVKAELAEFEESLVKFQDSWDIAYRQSQSIMNDAQRAELEGALQLIAGSLREMAAGTRELFREYQSGRIVRAATTMAKVDRHFAQFNVNINNLRVQMRAYQREGIQREKEQARVLGKLEYFFAAMAVLVLVFMVMFGHSLSQRIRSTQQLLDEQRAKILAASKMATLGEMAGGIAHEINNPLAIIHMQSVLLKDIGKSGKIQVPQVLEAAETIENTTSRITRIIKGLRFFARDGAGDPFEVTSLSSIVDDTLVFCREKFKNQDLSLRVELPTQPILVNCRSTEISQVLLNLISNASEAVVEQRKRWILVELKENAGFAEISVTDSGPGIPEQNRAKLMQPFFTTKEVGRGMGLGLSISKGIAESHGGRLVFEADSPSTKFTLWLPKAGVT